MGIVDSEPKRIDGESQVILWLLRIKRQGRRMGCNFLSIRPRKQGA